MGTAFTEENTSVSDTSPEADADLDGNPIPQTPADTDAVDPGGDSDNANPPMKPDGRPPDAGFSFSSTKGTFAGDKSKPVHGTAELPATSPCTAHS
ncbi:hypothetical protein [Streptomyces sp. LaBMicrA B280]|uniref:hypothetical protein n=1 Tax=Streptomyces sp. LaBMicrA B280 TaxID=3391001 RepID=UPI003BA7CED6